MAGSVKCALFLLAGPLLASAWPAAAQVKLGETSTNLNGTVSFGYSADYGSAISSDHNWDIGGSANMSGYFYSPKFLTYNANFYLNQSRANSNFQSISNTSGVSLTSNIFGGSHFPGAISYTKAIDAEGNYDVPGLANYVTHGNNDALGISWGFNFPHAPSFSAGYQMGSNQYSVYGTDDQGSSKFRTLNLHSSYRLAGFSMGAFYTTGESHALIPEVVTGEAGSESQSDNSGYGFNVSHSIPFQGSVSASINRSEWNDTYSGSNSTGTIDLVNTTASIHPTQKLSFSASANYSDNLAGQLIQAVIGAGGAVSLPAENESSNSLDLLGVASYIPVPNVQTSVYAERRVQLFEGDTYGQDSIGGSASFSHQVLEGNLNASLTVTENISEQTGEDSLSFSTNENYTSDILGWHVTGMFGYQQNVQTLLVTYMNSSFNYSVSARRRWGAFHVGVGGSASRTALTQQAGDVSSNQSYYGSVGYDRFLTANGSYSKASGQALATGAGLIPVPIPTPVLPSTLVSLYGGDSYAFALSSTPVKNLVLSASYSRSLSNTSSNGVSSLNETDEYNALIEYHVRKLNFDSGYARLGQGFSGSGTGPEVVSSFYIGVSRWFNLF